MNLIVILCDQECFSMRPKTLVDTPLAIEPLSILSPRISSRSVVVRTSNEDHLNCSEAMDVVSLVMAQSSFHTYAVVTANTLSGRICIPKTKTKVNMAVKTRIIPSLTSRMGMKKRITIGRTGHMLATAVTMPLAIRSGVDPVKL